MHPVFLRWGIVGLVFAVLGGVAVAQQAAKAPTPMTVYLTPTCGCCAKWADHMRAAGFRVSNVQLADLTELKTSYSIPPRLHSCHTALVDGYVVEGHIPADVVRRLIAERPTVTGLAVPGMPMGSPGMEGPYKQPYDVYTFDRKGDIQVFARIR